MEFKIIEINGVKFKFHSIVSNCLILCRIKDDSLAVLTSDGELVYDTPVERSNIISLDDFRRSKDKKRG